MRQRFGAYGAIAARELGYRIPDDLSVVSFDDIHFAQEHEIKLTTIRRPISKLGYLASENLIARLTDSTKPVGPERMIIETEWWWIQHRRTMLGGLTYDFPDDFIWGAATASYQIEGAFV